MHWGINDRHFRNFHRLINSWFLKCEKTIFPYTYLASYSEKKLPRHICQCPMMGILFFFMYGWSYIWQQQLLYYFFIKVLRLLRHPDPSLSRHRLRPSAAPSRSYTKSAEEDFSALCEADLRRLRRHFLFRQEAEKVPVLGRTAPPYILFSHHLRRLVDFTSLDHLGFQVRVVLH